MVHYSKRIITNCRVIPFWIKLDTLLFYSEMISKRDYIPNREKNPDLHQYYFFFQVVERGTFSLLFCCVVLLIHNSSLDNDSFHPHLSRIQSKQTPAARTTIDSSILHPLLFSPFYELQPPISSVYGVLIELSCTTTHNCSVIPKDETVSKMS